MNKEDEIEIVARAIARQFYDDESAWAAMVDEAIAAIAALDEARRVAA